MQQLAEERVRIHRVRGCSKRNCAAWIRCCCAPRRRPASPAGTRSRWIATVFADEVTAAIAAEPLIDLRRDEVTALTDDAIWIVASGPLTSGPLAEEIARLTGSGRLYFYDSISPIVDADTVDTSIAYLGIALRQVHRRHRRLPELPVR